MGVFYALAAVFIVVRIAMAALRKKPETEQSGEEEGE